MIIELKTNGFVFKFLFKFFNESLACSKEIKRSWSQVKKWRLQRKRQKKSRSAKKFEDLKLIAQDQCQTIKKLSESLNVD